MIPDFFISLINSLVDLLPSIGIDWGSYTLQPLFDVLEKVNYYLPITESFILIGAVMAFYVFRLAYRFVVFLIERIVI
ncbi:hypothetical protein [Clostridium sp.]|jgi:hypothetical protein|uniref:hypothetical protein n=1 Tax=Clostridium sp. TaxID=1506 RepID=UPI00290DB944|nr:hypothetical protein [Clostridium sp.]MDU7215840.1 hypothetical protein [Clostridium sp.]MDU7238120.1 hypothetical protein [Clostridium perfringens]